MKLALVVDKSQAFIGFQREKFLNAWGSDPKESKQVTRLQDAGGATLFGGEITSIVTLEDTDAIKEFVSSMESMSREELARKISNGLFVSTTVARTSTKKLEAVFASAGGQVVLTTTPKGEKTTMAERLVSDLRLNRETKAFLISYVGDDYEAVIPLVKTLSLLTPAQQEKVSENDIYLRLPKPPGAMPPWEIEKPLLEGNVGKTIEAYRRIVEHGHLLVVLKVLNNKFQSTYRVSALLASGVQDDEALAKATGVNPRQMWLYKKNYKTYGVDRIQKVVQILAELERCVKGGSAVDSDALMEAALIKIVLILKSR